MPPNSSSPWGLKTSGAVAPRTSGLRVTPDAGADAVDDVRRARGDQIRCEPAGTSPEPRVRRAPIEDRRTCAARQRERAVVHVADVARRMIRHLAPSRRIHTACFARRARDHGDAPTVCEVVAHQVVEVALEPAEPVQPIEGPAEHHDAERRWISHASLDERPRRGRPARRAQSPLAHRRCVRRAGGRPRPCARPAPGRTTRRATSRARPWALSDSRPVCSCTTMSWVPPVFIAAMGTPRAAASSRTRLSDSGPCDGNTSSAAWRIQPRHLVARQPSLDAKVEAGCAGAGFERATKAAVTDHYQRPGQRRRPRDVDEVARALVGLELADVERVGLFHRTRRDVGDAPDAGDVDRVWNLPDVGSRQLRRACAKVGANDRADGDDRIGRAQSLALAREIGTHVGDERPRKRAGRPRATAQASAHVGRRAGLAQPIRVEVVDQIGPVAHRPVVPNRRHHRHASRLPRTYCRHRRQNVLGVDDLRSRLPDAPHQTFGELSPTAARS